MPVQDRLHFAVKLKPRRTVPGLDDVRLGPGRCGRSADGGPLFCRSWQPTQEAVSPGIAAYQLRINCWAFPSASSGWTKTGVLAGTRKIADPSSWTGTVPRIFFTSHPPSLDAA